MPPPEGAAIFPYRLSDTDSSAAFMHASRSSAVLRMVPAFSDEILNTRVHPWISDST